MKLKVQSICGGVVRRGTVLRGRAAFTLLELMVALLVFGLVLTSLYSTWVLVVRGNSAALKIAAEGQRARMTIRALEDALVAAEMFPQNGGLYQFVADTSGAFAAISLAGPMSESFPGSGYFEGERLRRVTFMVTPGAQGNDLVLQQNSILAAETDQDRGVYSMVLARNVTLFTLEFWDRQRTRGEWIPEWTWTNQLPQLVRVTLGVGQSSQNARMPDQLVSRVVALPSGGVLQ